MNATALDRPLSILIVDDEPPARRRLRSLLAAHPTARVVAEAAGVAEARAQLNEHAPDLAFLDIQLRGEDAFALLSGAPLGAAVVFVTAHAEHALRAFECDVLDYLLKPIRPERLAAALARAERWRAALESPARRRDGVSSLSLWSRKGLRRVAYDDIVHIVARDDHSELYLRDGTSHLDGTRMEGWERRLPAPFLRTHRSHIVNLSAAVGVCRRYNGWMIELAAGSPARTLAVQSGCDADTKRGETDGVLIPISRGRVAAVRAALREPAAGHAAIHR
jgi:DNA-binding LytR/AlgR family response regulator